MRVFVASVLFLCLWIAAGCGQTPEAAPAPVSSNPMVGTWKLQLGPNSPNRDMYGTVTFTEDRFSMDFSDGTAKQKTSGRYTRDGKIVSMIPEDEAGKPVAHQPQKVMLADDMKSFRVENLHAKMVKQ